VGKYVKASKAPDDIIIRRMRIAYCISKATDTRSEYFIVIAFPLQYWLRESASVLPLYVRLSCWSLTPSARVQYKEL